MSTRSSIDSPVPDSGRPSFDPQGAVSAASTPTAMRSASASPSLHVRRNRTALRDYYNIRPTRPGGSLRSSSFQASVLESGTELDSSDFDPQKYVDHLLSTSDLSTVLKAENTLVGDIRMLDGERKALVYDNYSKLIRAVETIGKMRRSMDERGTPLTMTKTLGPAIAFVAESAGGLIQEGEEQRRQIKASKDTSEAGRQKRAERETVKWVLAMPDRLKTLLDEGRKEEAIEDWGEADRLLQHWEGVKGVSEVREACNKIMGSKGANGNGANGS